MIKCLENVALPQTRIAVEVTPMGQGDYSRQILPTPERTIATLGLAEVFDSDCCAELPGGSAHGNLGV